MLRHKADIKFVLYMIATTGLLFWQWSLDHVNWGLFTLACFMGVSVSTMAHNHNHLRVWKSKALNVFTDHWITLFYGFPSFAWIPTHNMNHHKLNNREGDYTKTYRFSEKNNLVTLLTYPSISGYYQQPAVMGYMKKLWNGKNRRRFWSYFAQAVSLVIFLGVALVLDWKKALLYIFIPQQCSLFAVLIFNYVQHVHTDEQSKYNHSRNFVGWGLNAFLFNNGYHFVHHEQPGLHWSKAPAAHAAVADKIDPVLNEQSFFWYLLRVYVLGIFVPSFRTRSMRLARIAQEGA